MTQQEGLDYQIDGRQQIAETDDLRVQILTLEQGEEIPWHYRTGDAFGSQYPVRFFAVLCTAILAQNWRKL